MADQAAGTAAELQAQLGQLGGLAGAGFAADDDDLVGVDGSQQFVPLLVDRQGLVKRGHRQALASSSHLVGRRLCGSQELRGQPVSRLAGLDPLRKFAPPAQKGVAVADQATGQQGIDRGKQVAGHRQRHRAKNARLYAALCRSRSG